MYLMKMPLLLLILVATIIVGCSYPVSPAPASVSITPESDRQSPTSSEPRDLPSPSPASSSMTPVAPPSNAVSSEPSLDVTTVLISQNDVLPRWRLTFESFEEFNASVAGWSRFFVPVSGNPGSIRIIGNDIFMDSSATFENKVFVYRSEAEAHSAFFAFREKYRNVVSETKQVGAEGFAATEAYDPTLGAREVMAFRVANVVVTLDAFRAEFKVDLLARTVEQRITMALGTSKTFRDEQLPYAMEPVKHQKAEAQVEYRDNDGFLVKGKIPGIITGKLRIGYANRNYWVIYLDSGGTPQISPGGGLKGTLGQNLSLYTYMDNDGSIEYQYNFTPSISIARIISKPGPDSQGLPLTRELRERLYAPTLEAWSRVLGTPVSMPELSEYAGTDFHGIPIHPQAEQLRRLSMPAKSADNLVFVTPVSWDEMQRWYYEKLTAQGWVRRNLSYVTFLNDTYYRDGEVLGLLHLDQEWRLIYWSSK